MILAWFAALAEAADPATGGFSFETPVFHDPNAIFVGDAARWRAFLNDAARDARLPALGDEDPRFGIDRSDEAVWRVGLAVEVTCFPLSGYLRAGHARCVATGDVEIRDASTGASHFRGRTEVAAERDVGEPLGVFAEELVLATAKALFVQPAFRAAVRTPIPPAAAVPLRPCTSPPVSLPAGSPVALSAGFTSLGGQPGLLVAPDGLGLVSSDAVGRATTVKVRLPEGVELSAEVLRRDPAIGLALVDLAGDRHRCRAPAPELNPVARWIVTTTAGGALVLVPADGADEPGNLALTANGTVAGAAGRPWAEVARALGIGTEPGGEPADLPPDDEDLDAPEESGERSVALLPRPPVWSTAERRTTRGLLTATGTFVLGGLATWAVGQGEEPPITGSPLVVANTHLWASALVLGAVSGVQVASAVRSH